MHSIAIFGGTFDPVHNGHIKTSINIQAHVHFDRYCFLPCKVPIIKAPTIASTTQRIDMLQLAIKDSPLFQIDLREINRETPSYMVDTLDSFRKEFPNASISLILGYDAFLSLPKWHEWEKIISLSHLFVINRAAFSSCIIPESIIKLLQLHKNTDINELKTHSSGFIYEFDAGSYDLSSTALRAELKIHSPLANQSIESCNLKKSPDAMNQQESASVKNIINKDSNIENKLPKEVYQYITSLGLYKD